MNLRSELVRAGNMPSRLWSSLSTSLTDAYEARCLTPLITLPAVVTAATCLTSPSSDLKEVNEKKQQTLIWVGHMPTESKVSFDPYVRPKIFLRH